MNGFHADITQGELKDHLGELKGGSVWCCEREMTANPWVLRRKRRWPCRIARTRYLVWLAGQDAPLAKGEPRHGEKPASHPGKRPARLDCRASHIPPGRLPSCGRTRRRVEECTTFFSRHGFKSWLLNNTRIVSRPTRGTSFRLTASSAIKRSVQRACPAGGSLHSIAMTRCFCEASRSSFEPRPLRS